MPQADVDRLIAELWRTVSKYNGSRNWEDVMGEVRDTCAHHGLDGARSLEMVFVAAANRDLVGTGTYTRNHYDVVNYPSGILVDPVHPDGAEPHGRPVAEDRIPYLKRIFDFVEEYWTVDENGARRIESQFATCSADLAVTVAESRGMKKLKGLDRIRTMQWMTLTASRRIDGQAPEVRAAVLAELHRAVLALVLQGQVGNEWSEFPQHDYDALTSVWREVVGSLHDDDEDLYGQLSAEPADTRG